MKLNRRLPIVNRTGKRYVYGRIVSVGIATGVLAAFGFYLHDRAALVAVNLSLFPLLVVGSAGAYVQLFSPRLRQSISSAIVSFVTGIAVYLFLQTVQLWVFSYIPGARDALLAGLLQRALVGLFLEFAVVYWSGYLFLVSIDAYRA
jgi:hypothetical protein